MGLEGTASIVFAALAVGVSAAALIRSLRTAIPRSVAQRLDAIEAESTRWRTAANGIIEEAQDLFERIERKRASAAAAASKASRGAAGDAIEEDPEPRRLSRAELRLARRQGAA